MDLNPLFTHPTSFHPSSADTRASLQLFRAAGIELVHGWLVDPEAPEVEVMGRVSDYDSAVNLVVEADHKCGGWLLMREGPGGVVEGFGHGAGFERGEGSSRAGGSAAPAGTEEQKKMVEDGTYCFTCSMTSLG